MKEKTFIQPVLSGGPSFSSNDRASLLEVLQRSRRIETRLTRLLETEGIQTGIQRPWWVNDTVMVPSPMTTIDAIMKCIPEGWSKPVLVLLKEDQNFVSLCRETAPEERVLGVSIGCPDLEWSRVPERLSG